VKIASWNIQGGGGSRLRAIADELIRTDADVYVIGEYMCGRSESLLTRLADAGWSHTLLPSPPRGYGGVAVVSRLPMEAIDSSIEMGDQAAYRHIALRLPSTGLQVRAVYGPLHKQPYQQFWDSLLADLAAHVDEPVLVIGDFNSGMPKTDTEASTLFCSRYFGQLPGIGYTDLWREVNGADAREYTWECTQKGAVFQFRLDHAFGSPTLAGHLQGCEYDHTVRRSKLSDHSLLTVSVG